jgi:peptide deformylase
LWQFFKNTQMEDGPETLPPVERPRRPIGTLRPWQITAATAMFLLLALTVMLILPSDSSETRTELKLVKPGAPLEHCKELDMSDTNLSLDFVDDLIRAVAANHMTMSTALHFGLSQCVLVMCDKSSEACQALINPRITHQHGSVPVTHEDTQLCANPKAMLTNRHADIDVQWYDVERKRINRHFTKPLSYKLQHLLDVLYGEDVCG